jgi:hypothetical protein
MKTAMMMAAGTSPIITHQPRCGQGRQRQPLFRTSKRDLPAFACSLDDQRISALNILHEAAQPASL